MENLSAGKRIEDLSTSTDKKFYGWGRSAHVSSPSIAPPCTTPQYARGHNGNAWGSSPLHA